MDLEAARLQPLSNGCDINTAGVTEDDGVQWRQPIRRQETQEKSAGAAEIDGLNTTRGEARCQACRCRPCAEDNDIRSPAQAGFFQPANVGIGVVVRGRNVRILPRGAWNEGRKRIGRLGEKGDLLVSPHFLDSFGILNRHDGRGTIWP